MSTINIAIDGPSGAGKSTIAKLVAKEKGFIYVDTGAMYRALGIHFLKHGCEANGSKEDTAKIISLLPQANVEIAYENGSQQVLLNGENVTAHLREEAVGNMASKASVIPEVRAHLLKLQRDLAATHNVVMDGRDIGTVILPDASLKIFLTASADARAKRRFLELQEKGQEADFETIKADIIERDTRDSSRDTAPLKQADDAHLVDSSEMTIDEVVSTILSYLE